RAQPGEIHARPRAALEDDAFLPVPVENRVHRVIDRQDEARGALRLRLDPHVEPDGAVERQLLLYEQVRQLVLERAPIVRRGEVVLRGTPLADGGDHAANELPDAALSLRRSQRTPEVLRNDDVGGELRPPARHLDVALLEDGLTALALDEGR